MGDFADDQKYDYTDYESESNIQMCTNCGELVHESELVYKNNKSSCTRCS